MAITVRYVTPSGSGTYAQSTSALTPCSLDTALVNAANGDDFKLDGGNGAYTQATSRTVSVNANTTDNVVFEPLDANTPVVNLNSGIAITSSGTGVQWRGIKFVGSHSSYPFVASGGAGMLYGCHFENTATTAGQICGALSVTGEYVVQRCVMKSASTDSANYCVNVVSGGTNGVLIDCLILTKRRGVTASGTARMPVFIGCTLANYGSQAGEGIYGTSVGTTPRGFLVLGCTLYNFTDGLGYDASLVPGSNVCGLVSRTLFHTCTTGINMPASDDHGLNLTGNAWWNCGTKHTLGTNVSYDEIALSADPCTNAAGLDFTLNGNLGGGAALRSISLAPGQETLSVSWHDTGALQSRPLIPRVPGKGAML